MTPPPADAPRKASEHARAATRILREEAENAETPAMRAPDMNSLKAQAFQALLEAARDDDLGRLHMAITLMARQTSVAELASDIRRSLARQYGP